VGRGKSGERKERGEETRWKEAGGGTKRWEEVGVGGRRQ
jgi:hypothetical protein